MNSDKIIEKALVDNNVLSREDAAKFLSQAQTAEEPFRTFLIQHEVVSEEQILISLSQSYQIKRCDLKNAKIKKSITERIPIKFAWYFKFMPVEIKNNVLTIACSEPLPLKTQDEIRMHLGLEVNSVLVKESELMDALKKYYGFASDTIDRIMTKEPARSGTITPSDQWIEDLEQQSEDPTVSHLVNQIILEAYKKRATDIHIEPYRNKVRFRYRIDGVLVDANLPDQVKHFLPSILSRIKILANLSITEKRLPQDGSAVVKTKEQQLDLRISTMPTPRGESMVIRILPTKVMLFSLEKLGFDQDSVQKFRYLLNKPHGIIFMTGPTGSGKTTTLYACLNEINATTRKIITLEDPVEYEMDGITQVQVNPKLSFTFSTGLRSILRHDPDIIMVGEVRDLETAEIAIRTALTGHLVFSTLHTNDAASGITRLIDMGVEPYLVASSVEAFVAQRLVRVICPKCKVIDDNPMVGVKEEIAHSLKLEDENAVKIYKGEGCDHCNNTGFYGRKAIYEILMMDDTIRTAILEKPRSDYIKRRALQEGLLTLRQNGWRAVLEGFTTPDEVLNVTVKDEVFLEEEDAEPGLQGDASPEADETVDYIPKAVRLQKIKENDEWKTKNKYDSRIYPRSFLPVEMRYQLMKRDSRNTNSLIAEGTQITTVTQDISARGLRFSSKSLISIGSLLEVQIQFGSADESIQCLAKVCRIEEDSRTNTYSTAVYYLDISSADRAKINNFVEEMMKQEERVAAQGEK